MEAVDMLIFALTATILFHFIISSSLDGTDLNNRKRDFEEDLKLAIQESQITWKKVKNLGDMRDLNQNQVIDTIKVLDREILKGTEKSLKEYGNLVNGYLEEYEKDEPFENMPDEIRIHMERLKEKLGTEDELLEPLVAKIKELLDSNNSESKKQKFYTFAGFIFGMLGFVYLLYTYTQEAKLTVSTSPKVKTHIKNNPLN